MKKAFLKKAISMVLTLVLLISAIPMSVVQVSAAAYTGIMRQTESQWLNYSFNGGTLYATGCGIFSLANAVGYLTGEKMDVVEVATWAHNNGMYNVTGADGIYRTSFYHRASARYGPTYGFTIDCDSDNSGYWSGAYDEKLKRHLEGGGTAVIHVYNHFMALVGYDRSSNKFHLYDCAPRDRRNTLANGGDLWFTEAQLSSGYTDIDWFCLVSPTVKDEEPPVISDVKYSEVSASGYTISCTVTDNKQVSKVAFPTWTVANSQDDLPANWENTQLGTKNGDRYTFRVNASDHNNETGMYATHIYAYDRAGNKSSLTLPAVEVRDDTAAPVISDVRISELSSSGYTITCKVTDDWGVSKVAFPTWTVANNQDDIPANWANTQLGSSDGDTFTFRVNASDHNNEGGYYATHIYAYDCAGNKACYTMDINVKDDTENPVVSDVEFSEISSEGYKVTCTVTDDSGIEKVAFPTWTVNNGQDDLAEQFMKTQLGTRDGDTFTFYVKTADHNNELGYYATHIYAVDYAGNIAKCEPEAIEVKDYVAEVEEKITLTSSATYNRDDIYLRAVKDSTTVEELLKQFENAELEVLDKNGNELSSIDKVGTGSVINLYNGTEVVDSVTVVVLGDVDGNAIVDTTDYMRVKQTFLRSFTLDGVYQEAADVDENTIVDSTDGMRIKSHFLGTYNLYA